MEILLHTGMLGVKAFFYSNVHQAQGGCHGSDLDFLRHRHGVAFGAQKSSYNLRFWGFMRRICARAQPSAGLLV